MMGGSQVLPAACPGGLPPGRRGHQRIGRRAGDISSTYIWQLRTGRQDNPTQRHLAALAAFFGVSPLYFFDQPERDRETIPPELEAALQDQDLRAMALRASGLSGRALRAITDMIESVRTVEGLDADDAQGRYHGACG